MVVVVKIRKYLELHIHRSSGMNASHKTSWATIVLQLHQNLSNIKNESTNVMNCSVQDTSYNLLSDEGKYYLRHLEGLM